MKVDKKVELSIGFSEEWWYTNYGISLSKKYFTDPEYRTRLDMEKERILGERFGYLGLGNKDPKPNPTLPLSPNPVASMYGVEFQFEKETVWALPLKFDDADLMNLRPISNVEETLVIKEGKKQLRYFEERYGWKWNNFSNCDGTPGILNIALAIGGNQILTDLIEKPKVMHHFFSCVTHTLRNFLDWRVTIWGRRPPTLGLGNCTDVMISPEMYLDFIFKQDEYLAEKYSFLGIHRDNKLDAFLDVYLQHLKLNAIDCGWDSNLKQLRKRLPVEKYHINFRIDPLWLSRAKKIEVMRYTEQWIEEGGGTWRNEIGQPSPALGLIIDCIDSNVPEENIEALFEVVERK